MKIGILTFHRSRNYGAVMQAYGLVYTLNKLGYDANVIDYKCKKIDEDLKKPIKSKNFIKSVIKSIAAFSKEKKFNAFNKDFLCLSKEKNVNSENISDVINHYDIVIVGSDQVWNTDITGNDGTFFLDNRNTKKISYAASCGDEIVLNADILNKIQSFNHISVRERALQYELENRGVVSEVVCDPTILAGKKAYSDILKSRIKKEKYVFVFMIWKSNKLIKNAKQYAEKNGLKLVTNKDCAEFMMRNKPEDFISWFANANCVFTNSFHGTVFSLLFHKKFISSVQKPNNKNNTRVEELLKEVGCQSNILRDEECPVLEIPLPDYEEVDRSLEIIKEKSKQYLMNAIND